MLPAVVTKDATSEELPLQSRRVVRPDEAVRCSFVNGGKRSWVSVAVSADGNARLF